jgi:hypothetical protein
VNRSSPCATSARRSAARLNLAGIFCTYFHPRRGKNFVQGTGFQAKKDVGFRLISPKDPNAKSREEILYDFMRARVNNTNWGYKQEWRKGEYGYLGARPRIDNPNNPAREGVDFGMGYRQVLVKVKTKEREDYEKALAEDYNKDYYRREKLWNNSKENRDSLISFRALNGPPLTIPGQRSFLESLPVIGHLAQAWDHLKNGRIGEALLSTLFAVDDLYLVKGVVKAGARLLLSRTGALTVIGSGKKIAAQSAVTERSGLGSWRPYAARTPNLPETATLKEVLDNRWIPHIQGITITGTTATDKSIRFTEMYKLTEALGIEYGLSRELVNGRAVYRLYSGSSNAVTIGESGNTVLRVIAHTHPSGVGRPSIDDMANINRAFLEAIARDPSARRPVRIIIYGSGKGQAIPYYPDIP